MMLPPMVNAQQGRVVAMPQLMASGEPVFQQGMRMGRQTQPLTELSPQAGGYEVHYPRPGQPYPGQNQLGLVQPGLGPGGGKGGGPWNPGGFQQGQLPPGPFGPPGNGYPADATAHPNSVPFESTNQGSKSATFITMQVVGGKGMQNLLEAIAVGQLVCERPSIQAGLNHHPLTIRS